MATKFAKRTIQISTFLDEEYVRRAIKFLEKVKKNEARIRDKKAEERIFLERRKAENVKRG